MVKKEPEHNVIFKLSDYLTVKETAALFGVTGNTVRNWDKAKILVAYRNPFNNYRLYKKSDIEHILNQIPHYKVNFKLKKH